MASQQLHTLTELNLKLEEQLAAQAVELQSKNRKLEIEAALEKVRVRATAMRISSELAETSAVLFQQLKALNIKALRTGVGIFDDANDAMEVWLTTYSEGEEVIQILDYFSLHVHPVFENIIPARKKNEPYALTILEGNEVRRYYQTMSTYLSLPMQQVFSAKEYFYSFFFSDGTINVITLQPLTEEECNILIRFAQVFGLIYTRFLDLQKAEARAREAKIEAALERVRAKAMAMHSSQDLAETIKVFYHQMETLNVAPRRCGVGLIDKETHIAEVTSMNITEQGETKGITGRLKLTEHPVLKNVYDNWLVQKEYHPVLRGNDIKEYYQVVGCQISFQNYPHDAVQYGYFFFFTEGNVYAWTEKEFTEDELKIYRRFTSVLSLTYKRYKDLKQAEAQAREAKIEAALERVRSRTMAMQHSDELRDAAILLFQQLKALGVHTGSCGFNIWDKEEKAAIVWMSSAEGGLQVPFKLPHTESEIYQQAYAAMKNGEDFMVKEVSGEALKKHFDYLLTLPDIGDVIKKLRESGYVFPEKMIYHFVYFNHGYLSFHTHEPVPETHDIFKRFAKVFDQTYTRFLDLQKAEAQVREAKIEAALERVRSQTMAMNKSQDLQQVVSVIFRELDKLDLKALRCGIGIINADNRSVDVWTTTTTNEGYEINFSGNESMDVHPMLQGVFAAWEMQEDFYYVLQGEDLISYYNTMTGDNYKLPDVAAGASVSDRDRHYYYCTFFLSGGLYFFREMPFTEEVIKVIRRFANAFSLAFKRFEDLKQSEARAIEAIKESSLDRVRAEIASMRTTDDLQRITPIIWRELTMLEVPFFRCGVFIIDEINTEVKIYLSAPDGHSLGVMNLPFNTNSVTINSVDHWRKGLVYTEHWNKETFVNWMHAMIEQGQIQSSEAYQDTAKPPESLDLHFVPFSQGMLYVGNSSPLTKEKIDLVKSLAETFSIAYARYEDFNKLELAKEQIEKTLVDLKQAQAQLVQSEKMASLGELTAGIAHEIQNPLNFVNNFSEVSKELLEEMEEELATGNTQQAMVIVKDVQQNLEKILRHGKQADGIVKGMLQHSRISTGVKEPTDINKLAHEYLHLAFHGLRAKDKSFNAALTTDYDDTIGTIDIIPQDIGRVILNLITNAFYAVTEKKKSPHTLKGSMEYEPVVTVTTKRLGSPSGDGGKIEIRVADNGNGIPPKVLDKIFQPFFTTKPTGQGTGLGLSLSYDIIKAHGGEMKVKTKEGEGAEFIIEVPIPQQ